MFKKYDIVVVKPGYYSDYPPESNYNMPKTQLVVVEATTGYIMVHYTDKNGESVISPPLNPDAFVLVDSKEYTVIIPDSINWDHVSSEFNYMARDKNDEVYLYGNKPELSSVTWTSIDSSVRFADVFKSYKRGTASWDTSLVKRPK